MDDLFASVNDLQARAKTQRKDGNLDTAIELLEQAAGSLESSYSECDRQAAPTELERRLAAELAETYGLLGGAHRQRDDLANAVAAYGKGRVFEASDRYGLGSTYASLNWVVTSVLADPSSLDRECDITTELQRLRGALAEHEARLETFDPWTEGDLALANVLGGADGEEAWATFLKMAPDYAVGTYAGTVDRLSKLDTSRRPSLQASLAALQGGS